MALLLAPLLGRITSYEALDYDSVADAKATVVRGSARFTVLTPQLIRFEQSATTTFEDRATLAIVNRKLPVPKFTASDTTVPRKYRRKISAQFWRNSLTLHALRRRAHHQNRQAHAHLHARRAILVVDALGKGRLGRVVVRRAQRRQPARHDQVARPARRDLPQLHREQQRHGARRVAPLRVGRRLARRLGGVRRHQELRPRRRGLVGVAEYRRRRRLPVRARHRLQGRAPRPRRRRR